MRRDFNDYHITQVPMTENQLGEMQMMEEVAEHVGMNYPETSDSRYYHDYRRLSLSLGEGIYGQLN